MLRDLPPTTTRNGRGTLGRITRGRIFRASTVGARGDCRTAGGVRLPYMPGLDGLRALAVTAVLLYHAELP